jgi:hypothetical protein
VPPGAGQEDSYALVGDAGRKNVEKKLRAHIARTSEWQDARVRMQLAQELRTEGGALPRWWTCLSINTSASLASGATAPISGNTSKHLDLPELNPPCNLSPHSLLALNAFALLQSGATASSSTLRNLRSPCLRLR